MTDRKKIIEGIANVRNDIIDGYITEIELAVNILTDALELLKEQEAITQKMWNALYAEEDELEKKFTQTDKQNEWIMEYRPWLQRGFEIAIRVIAEQEQ